MKKYGLIGYPLGHSFSGQYFTDKFRQLGLEHSHEYRLYPLASIEEVESVFNISGLAGLNVTIPYKEAIVPYLTNRKELPEGVDACNCIGVLGKEIVGYNTDVIGFEKTLLPLLKMHHNKAILLGNGGAAIAVKYVLQKLGVEYVVAGRSQKNGIDLLYSDVTPEILNDRKLIINTTPLGTWPNVDEAPLLPYHALTPHHLLYDLIYNPSTTAFLHKGIAAGATVKNGYDMLVEQAEASWRIWNNAQA